MIAEIVRGNDMPALIRYLFGPGRHNEHVNQHLVAGYADAVFSAPDRLWQSEPGVQREAAPEAGELGWEVEYPRSRWGTEVTRGYVWHCSLSLKAEEGQLTDAQWAEAAHAMVEALGFSGADGKSPCRWVAVRHGLSGGGNDHIHIAVNLVREDGTKAAPWRDFQRAGSVCSELEERFGLEHVPGRVSGRSVPEPSRADREISAARGEPEALRVRLERVVRACAAATRSEAEFVAVARSAGLLVRPRHSRGDPGRVTGYAVAERDGRQAYSRRTGTSGPVWFGGGKLATDLALPRLRARWQADPAVTKPDALAAWSAATGPDNAGSDGAGRRVPGRRPSLVGARGDMGAAADLLAAAAVGVEGSSPGPLSQAARCMARAAQEQPGQRNPGTAETVREMAGVFMSIMHAGTDDGVLILVRDVLRLIDQAAASASTATALRSARQASVLVNAGIAALSDAADRQAAAALTTVRSTQMSEPVHEEEALRQVVRAGEMVTQIRLRRGGTRVPAEIARLRAAGYTEATVHDDVLRGLLGEEKWAAYVADPARLAAAAAITDGDRAGYDMPAVLARAVHARGWEHDVSPSRSVAQVLHYRVKQELAKTGPGMASAAVRQERAGTRDRSAPDRIAWSAAVSRGRAVSTPFDGKLRDLLGEQRWQSYASDPGRADVAALIRRADNEGRAIGELLADVVNMRLFEDDPASPARSVADVLHYRLDRALGKPAPGDARAAAAQLPDEVAGLLGDGIAPAGGQPWQGARADPAGQQVPRSVREARCPPQGRDGR